MSFRHSVRVQLLSLLFGMAAFIGSASAAAPAAPTGMRATAISFDVLTLSWVDNASDETGFDLEYKFGTGNFAAFPSNMGADVESFFAAYVNTAGVTITMRVRAYNLTGAGGAKLTSAYSTAVAIVMPAASVTFLAPSNVSATSTSSSFTGTWTNNATNKTGFLVSGRRSSDTTDKDLANVINPPATITEVFSPSPFPGQYVPVEPGTSYSFIVRAYVTVPNASGATDTWLSAPSAAKTIVTKDAITSKTGTSGTPGAAFSHSFTNSTASAVTSRTLTPVPSGLAFNSSTGTLTGTYPPLGIYTLNYTLNYANSVSLTQTFYIRVRPATGPPVVATTIPAWTTAAGSTRDTPVAGTFTDVEAESAVRVSTTKGDMDFILFDTATPATVANFKNYLARYSDVVFHRSISNFVIQAGGYRSTGTGSNFNTVLDDPAVINEPGIANLRGTISMAKLGGNPNSATNEFFVSLADNRSNLDFQNGGFTVFGRVAGNGMAVADAISLLPTSTYSLLLDGSPIGSSFPNFPMDDATAPAAMDQTKVVKMNSVTLIPTINYTMSSNTNPAAVTASIVSGQVHLVALAGGVSTVTVTATDLDNLTASQNISVAVTDTFATWAARQSFPVEDSPEAGNPDGDTLNNLLEYAFLMDPTASNQAEAPAYDLLGDAPAAQTMKLTFPIRKFTTGLTYAVQVSAALDSGWTTIWSSTDGFSHAQVQGAVDAADRTLVTIKDTTAITPGTKRFMRTKVTQN